MMIARCKKSYTASVISALLNTMTIIPEIIFVGAVGGELSLFKQVDA